MTGIQYLTDEQGRRIAVQIDLRQHADLWEEFEDALVSESRSEEPDTPLEKIKTKLALCGKLRG